MISQPRSRCSICRRDSPFSKSAPSSKLHGRSAQAALERATLGEAQATGLSNADQDAAGMVSEQCSGAVRCLSWERGVSAAELGQSKSARLSCKTKTPRVSSTRRARP